MKNCVKFGLYVTGNATRLSKYLSTFEHHMPVECVVHDGVESSHLVELLAEKGISYYHIDLEIDGMKQKSQLLSDTLLAKLSAHSVDYCFCFGSRILKGALLHEYYERIINFHPSLLPAFPGLKSIDQALDYGAVLLGNTAHIVDEGIDTGAIIMQSVLEAKCFSGYDSVLDLQIPMLHQISRWITEGRLQVNERKVSIRNSAAFDGCYVPALEE